MDREPKLARRFFDRFEPVHAVTYFSPEARAAFDGLGFRGFWMGYFAARSAPLGVVPPAVVAAMFYNFSPGRVSKALPAAWEVVSPEAALRARQESAVAALRRYGLTDDDSLRTAADLAAKAARNAPLDGRPLFAANLARPWPDESVARLWHAGRDLKRHIEDRTDALALSALDALDDAEVETLFRTLTPITRAVVAGGDVPVATPMGLSRDDLDDDSAHLS